MKSAEANINEREAMTQWIGICQRLTAMSSSVCESGSCWLPAPARKPDLNLEFQGAEKDNACVRSLQVHRLCDLPRQQVRKHG